MNIPETKDKRLYLFKPLVLIVVLICVSIGAFVIVSQYYMNIMFEHIERQSRQDLVNVVSVARNSVEPVLKKLRSGSISREEAISRIRPLVRNMIYQDQDGWNYIFMSSYKGVMLVQPFEPEKELTNQWDIRDVKGLYIIRELVKAARNNPGGSFVHYYYYLPSVHGIQEKLAYVVGIPEIECYIASGMYMERSIQEQKDLLTRLKYLAIMLLVVVLIPISVAVFFLLKRNRLLLSEIGIRMKVEEDLRKSEEKYRSIFENSMEGIYQSSVEGRLLSANPALARISGYDSPEEMMESIKNIDEYYLDPRERKEVLDLLNEKGYIADYPLRLKRRDGGVIWTSHTARTVRDEKGNILYYEGSLEDITLRRQAEDDRRRLEEQLAHSQKMDAIGKLAGGIAHDFNNILMIIQGNVSMVKRRMMAYSPDNPDYQKLDLIEEYVARGSNLTRQLLGFARQGKYELKKLSVNDIIRKSTDFFIETRREIEAELRLQDDVFSIEADAGQMEQVLLNIFINSGQAMPEGGHLLISTENIKLQPQGAALLDITPGDYVRISITDSGTGMDKDTLGRIFEPFFTTKAGQGGTGLGLASAYGIIRNHGGVIVAESEPGKGSTFEIYLPSAGRFTGSVEAGRDEAVPVSGKGGILVVDDEPPILDLAMEFLTTLGYTVYRAENEDEAISVYRENHATIDLVILDMILRGMSGAQVLKALRAINPDVKILLSSGYSLQGEVKKVMEDGCLGFIQKPYSFVEMSNILKKVLNS